LKTDSDHNYRLEKRRKVGNGGEVRKKSEEADI
jgi:hypothetical protein